MGYYKSFLRQFKGSYMKVINLNYWNELEQIEKLLIMAQEKQITLEFKEKTIEWQTSEGIAQVCKYPREIIAEGYLKLQSENYLVGNVRCEYPSKEELIELTSKHFIKQLRHGPYTKTIVLEEI